MELFNINFNPQVATVAQNQQINSPAGNFSVGGASQTQIGIASNASTTGQAIVIL